MPLLSGRFFEVLVGTRPEPSVNLLSKVGLLYALEPILTIIYVVNMNSIWEKVMSSLRAQIFQRILIQKEHMYCLYANCFGNIFQDLLANPFSTSLLTPMLLLLTFLTVTRPSKFDVYIRLICFMPLFTALPIIDLVSVCRHTQRQATSLKQKWWEHYPYCLLYLPTCTNSRPAHARRL
ncbi:hypothetical protein HAX54_038980 [Datura stramonium]|uniref:Uncharacterized protein n=1 Tax=Datura stramonium TaxID=4076 RepID=A0ABS8SIS0_DATST|nr:hypothetical protein [Datura stramonium]